MSTVQKSLFCFGYGYSCDYLGHTLRCMGGWRIAGTTRDPEKMALMKEHNIKAFLFDHEKPLDDAHLFLQGVTHILISTPPDDQGDPTFRMHAEDIARMPSVEWVGYLSSTAVYGDRDGELLGGPDSRQPAYGDNRDYGANDRGYNNRDYSNNDRGYNDRDRGYGNDRRYADNRYRDCRWGQTIVRDRYGSHREPVQTCRDPRSGEWVVIR